MLTRTMETVGAGRTARRAVGARAWAGGSAAQAALAAAAAAAAVAAAMATGSVAAASCPSRVRVHAYFACLVCMVCRLLWMKRQVAGLEDEFSVVEQGE